MEALFRIRSQKSTSRVTVDVTCTEILLNIMYYNSVFDITKVIFKHPALKLRCWCHVISIYLQMDMRKKISMIRFEYIQVIALFPALSILKIVKNMKAFVYRHLCFLYSFKLKSDYYNWYVQFLRCQHWSSCNKKTVTTIRTLKHPQQIELGGTMPNVGNPCTKRIDITY